MEENWITTAEAVEISKFHIEYVRKLIRSRRLAARKWGREWMVSRQSLISYLQLERKPGPKQKMLDEKR